MSNVNILVDKIGINKNDAEWIIKNSKKHSIWIANQIIDNNLLFNFNIKNNFKKIIEWKKEDSLNFYNLKELDYNQALILAEEFLEAKKYKNFIHTNFSLKNKKVILDLGEYKWVQLKTKSDCIEEGIDMRHCIGGCDFIRSIKKGVKEAYSLRDINNRAHVTLDIGLFGDINNIFGKGNSTIHDSYIPYVAEFLSNITKWKRFKYDYNAHYINETISKIIIYSIHTNNYKLLNKIMVNLQYSKKSDIIYNLSYEVKERNLSSRYYLEKLFMNYEEKKEKDLKHLSTIFRNKTIIQRPLVVKKPTIFHKFYFLIKKYIYKLQNNE